MCRHVAGGGLDRRAETDRRFLARLALQFGPAGSGDSGSHAATVSQLGVGRVGDRVDVQRGHICLKNL